MLGDIEQFLGSDGNGRIANRRDAQTGDGDIDIGNFHARTVHQGGIRHQQDADTKVRCGGNDAGKMVHGQARIIQRTQYLGVHIRKWRQIDIPFA